MTAFRPSKGSRLSASWAASVEARLDQARRFGPGETISPVGRSPAGLDPVELRRRGIRVPFLTWIASRPFTGPVLRIIPGNVYDGGKPLEVSLASPWILSGEDELVPDSTTDPPETKPSTVWDFWEVPLPVDGLPREIVIDTSGGTNRPTLAGIDSGLGVVIADVYCPLPDPSSGVEVAIGTGGRIVQRVVGDIVGGGGGGVKIGIVSGGQDGVYTVDFPTETPGEYTSATLLATEVAEGATLPVGARVICHSAALQSIRGPR